MGGVEVDEKHPFRIFSEDVSSANNPQNSHLFGFGWGLKGFGDIFLMYQVRIRFPVELFRGIRGVRRCPESRRQFPSGWFRLLRRDWACFCDRDLRNRFLNSFLQELLYQMKHPFERANCTSSFCG